MESLRNMVNSGLSSVISLVVTQKPQEVLVSDLQAACVPVTVDACRTCANPCDVGHQEYPRMFMTDTISEMRGTIRPYMRQVVISTGKADWVREVTDENGSLAHLLPRVVSAATVGSSPKQPNTTYPPAEPTTRVDILNSSHRSEDDGNHRVLVFPDYKVVMHVSPNANGAQELYQNAVSPSVGRIGAGSVTETGNVSSYPLRYACVILLCSHKRRDYRCHISAPLLEASFCHALEGENWIVHYDLEDEDCMGLSLEDLEGTEKERDNFMADKLREASEGTAHDQKMALILKISHIGGHKFAGNVIIYTPQGTGVWYGRVSPHEVPAVVKHTILEGKILPLLLRGGVNLNRGQGQSLLDW